MNTRTLAIGFAVLSLSVGRAAGADVDTSKWKCEYCPFVTGLDAEITPGLGYQSSDSFRFGNYTGLDERGLFVTGDADLDWLGADASYASLRVRDAGLDSRSIEIGGGRQGSYRLEASYRELPRLIEDTSRTPFLGVGGDVLSLPGGWTRAATTGGMSDLDASLYDVDLRNRRRQIGVGGSFLPGLAWTTSVHFQHETRHGLRPAGGTFVLDSAILPMPLDYTTDEIDAAAAYTQPKFQLQLAYFGSLFRDDDESLSWQNPYTALSAGADEGRLATAPDSQFHQLVLSGAAEPVDHANVSGSIAAGRMTQNAAYVPATINPNLSASLPRTSLDGRVNTLSANLRGSITPMKRLRVSAEYRYDDRANHSPRDSYPQVETDVFLGPSRTNLPYSFTDHRGKLAADYRAPYDIHVSLGADYAARTRDLQAVARTREGKLWAGLRAQPKQLVEVRAKFERSRRLGSAFEPIAEIQPPENVRSRAFNLADRDRTAASLQATTLVWPRVTLGLRGDFAHDEYDASQIGLTDARDIGATVDASWAPLDDTALTAFISHDQMRSQQRGSQSFGPADWQAINRDRTDVAGLNLERRRLAGGRVDLAARYTCAISRGSTDVDNGVSSAFPDLQTRLHSVLLTAAYRMRPDLRLSLGYRYERYDDDNWHFDGVAPDTIPNVLALGQGTPDYRVHLVLLSVSYRFATAAARTD